MKLLDPPLEEEPSGEGSAGGGCVGGGVAHGLAGLEESCVISLISSCADLCEGKQKFHQFSESLIYLPTCNVSMYRSVASKFA